MTLRHDHWLFIEPGLSGHHAGYLERLASLALDRGIRPVVVLSDSESARVAADTWRLRLPGAEFVHFPLPAVHGRSTCGFAGLARQELSYWRYCRDAYASVAATHSLDRVFLPYLDYCLYACGLLGSPFSDTQFEGICMRPGFHYSKAGVVAPHRFGDALKELLFARMLRISTLRRLFTNDETLARYAQSMRVATWSKLHYLPDPAELIGTDSRDTARLKLGIAPESPVILAYGSLEEHKGLDRLLAAMAHPRSPDSLVLLVAGQCSSSARMLLAGDTARELARQKRLITLDRRITDEEEQMCFAASDISWLGYREKYCMSGVLVKAIRAGHRVVASDQGVVHWYATRLPQMICVNTESVVAIADALRSSVGLLLDKVPVETQDVFFRNDWRNFARLVFG